MVTHHLWIRKTGNPMSRIDHSLGLATAAKIATLNDFSGLSNGEVLTLFFGNVSQDRIDWVHDRVERDLVFGAVKLEDGTTLPIDCYLENDGTGLFFDTRGTEASVKILGKDVSEIIYLSMPLPSQLPERLPLIESSPRYGTFSEKEKKMLKTFAEGLISSGFREGPSWRSSGFDIRVPVWESSWRLQNCDVYIFLRREWKGLLKSTRFFVSVTDHSHRSIQKHGTRLLAKDGLSLAEAVQLMSSGIDLAWVRSR